MHVCSCVCFSNCYPLCSRSFRRRVLLSDVPALQLHGPVSQERPVGPDSDYKIKSFDTNNPGLDCTHGMAMRINGNSKTALFCFFLSLFSAVLFAVVVVRRSTSQTSGINPMRCFARNPCVATSPRGLGGSFQNDWSVLLCLFARVNGWSVCGFFGPPSFQSIGFDHLDGCSTI